MFGDRLKAAREKMGLSQQELADRLGVKQPTVSSWECGKRSPGDATKVKIGRILDTDMNYLLPVHPEDGQIDGDDEDDPLTQLVNEFSSRSLTRSDVDFLVAAYKAHKEKK